MTLLIVSTSTTTSVQKLDVELVVCVLIFFKQIKAPATLLSHLQSSDGFSYEEPLIPFKIHIVVRTKSDKIDLI